MAEQLVDSLSTKFDAKRYPDVYREKVRALVEKKAEGETIQAPEEEEPAKVVNLADALSASLAAAKARGTGKGEPAAGERRHRQRAAARTTTTRRRARKKPA
jgi:DNA end-binding protein Ku